MNKTLMTDFYELTMAQTYFNLHEENKVAYFDIFFRSNPFNGGYAISGGLDAIIDYVLNFKGLKILTFSIFLKHQYLKPDNTV